MGSTQPGYKAQTQALISARDNYGMDVVIAKGRTILMAQTGTVASSSSSVGNSFFSNHFEFFAKEIALTFNYFSKNFKKEEIRNIFWSADEVYEPRKWIEGLRARFEIPVHEWDFKGMIGQTDPITPAMIVTLGACLRPVSWRFLTGFLGPKNPNLMPVEASGSKLTALSEEAEKSALIRWGSICGAAALGCILALHLFFLPKIFAVKKTARLVSELSTTQLSDQKNSLSAKISFLSGLADPRIFWTDKLSLVATNLPAEIQLTSLEALNVDDKNAAVSLRIEGDVYSNPGKELDIANHFVGDLARSGEFMKGFDSAVLARVKKSQATDQPSGPSMSFAVECASKNKTGTS